MENERLSRVEKRDGTGGLTRDRRVRGAGSTPEPGAFRENF